MFSFVRLDHGSRPRLLLSHALSPRVYTFRTFRRLSVSILVRQIQGPIPNRSLFYSRQTLWLRSPIIILKNNTSRFRSTISLFSISYNGIKPRNCMTQPVPCGYTRRIRPLSIIHRIEPMPRQLTECQRPHTAGGTFSGPSRSDRIRFLPSS